MADEIELKRESELADARLEVAEKLWWPMGILAAISFYLKWENWFLSALSLIIVYFLVTYKYRRESAKTEDAYYKVACLGKYHNQI